MSNWDDEDFEPPVAGSGAALPVAGDAWEGEDEDVKDDWDADSDEEKKKAEDANAEQGISTM